MGKKISKLLDCQKCEIYRYPLFIAVSFFVGAIVWIYVTESLLVSITDNLHEYVYFETAKSLFFIAASALIIYYLVLKNNKQIKAANDIQNAAKEEMANFFNASLDKIVIISKNGRIIGYNEAFLHTWPFEALDDTVFLDGIFSEDRAAMEAEIKKVFDGEKTVDFENRFFDAEGKYAWHSWRISRSADGEKVYLVGRNIGRQKKHLDAIEEEKEECLWLLDNMSLPMYKTDRNGNVLYFNKAWKEFTTEELSSQLQNGWVNSVYVDDRELVKKSFLEAVNKRDSWMVEYRLKHFDGSYHWICDSAKPLYSKKGEYTGYVGAIYDIQKLKSAEEELRKKEELLIVQSRFAAMGEMISMIAHQWRQPITAIGMSANNMIVDIELEDIELETFKSHLKSITEQVQYLSKTIDDFRNFFKPNIKKEAVKATELLQKALKMLSKSYENNGLSFEFDDQSGGAYIEAHFGELLQAVLSILNNAKDVLVDRKVDNGKVWVTIEPAKENYLCIDIEDNGGGIEEGILPMIFEPYFTTKNEKSGTGLGLYMAKIIVEKHHAGELTAHNTQKGALFRILLPISQNGTKGDS